VIVDLTLLGQDSPCPTGKAGHVQEGEREAASRELCVVPTVELATGGDAAHLVVELRPGSAVAVVAIPDEGDEIRGGKVSRWSGLLGSLGR
jgi:hypothetical protein